MIWGIQAVDLDPAQQVTAIIGRLTGDAKEMALNLSFNEITQGGIVGGQPVDAVTYLLAQLAGVYAPLGEEQRMQSMTELFHFKRNHNEPIDQLISRFRLVRWKASQGQVGMTMSWEGYSWMLLRACGVNHHQLLTILQPTNNRYPTTEAEFEAMCLALRRMGHVLENAPNNIAQHLRPNAHAFPVFGLTEATGAQDPLQTSDPWSQARSSWQPSLHQQQHTYRPSV